MLLAGLRVRVLVVSEGLSEPDIVRAAFAANPDVSVEHASELPSGESEQEADMDAVFVHTCLLDERGLAWLDRRRASSGSAAPVIVLVTSADEEAVAVQALSRGALQYLLPHEHDLRSFERAIRAAIDRRRMLQQFTTSGRLETVGRFVTGVAHDFSNLLTVILGTSERMLSRVGPEHPLYADCRTLRTGAHRAAALARQLLAFCRDRPAEPTLVDVAAVVRQNESMLRTLVGATITLTLDLAPGDHQILADRTQLEQILFNLAANARDAMAGGGRLTIAVETAGVGEDDGCSQAGRQEVRLRVIDNGEGMSPETLAHAFDPFFTTKPPGKGTGLGLAIVRQIAERFGGRVHIASRPNSGTTVTASFPAVQQQQQQPMPSYTLASPAARAPGRGETLLVVEDDDDVRMLVADMLEAAGYRTLSAEGPEQALHLAREHAGGIDLLLTDLAMPGMSGVHLVHALRELRPDLQALCMSGYAEYETLGSESLLEGMRLIAKPFDGQTLIAAVRAALDAHAAPSGQGL